MYSDEEYFRQLVMDTQLSGGLAWTQNNKIIQMYNHVHYVLTLSKSNITY